MSAAESIRDLTLPVVLISANGLICLALYNRLAAITARLRAFCREQFEMQMRQSELLHADNAPAIILAHVQARLAVLETQRATILRRAIFLRNALMLLLGAILGLLLTSLLLGYAAEFSLIPEIPLGTLVLGTLCMIAGVVFAIAELAIALEPVTAELPSKELLASEHTSLHYKSQVPASHFGMPNITDPEMMYREASQEG